MYRMKQKGSLSLVIGIVIVLIVIGGVAYINRNDGVQDQMMDNEEGAMMDDASNVMIVDTGSAGDDMVVDTMGSDEGMMEDGVMDTDEMMGTFAQVKGVYEDYAPEKVARAKNGTVVLFFHAEWCPICRTLESDIEKNMKNIPDGVSILKVDYDNSATLKKRYGVTVQHTFVEVDAAGNLISKWSDSNLLSDVLVRLK